MKWTLHLQAEEKKRTKARKAATKTGKPLFGEDGVARGLLEKYDEEAEEDGMQIDESGVVPDERARRQEEMRRKAAEGMLQRCLKSWCTVCCWLVFMLSITCSQHYASAPHL